MKWNNIHLGCAVFLAVGYSSLSFSTTPHVVYGFEKAKQFNGRINKEAFIQAGSFVDLSKAHRYQQALQSKTIHHVSMTHKGRFYAVLIGPLLSSSEIRKTAMSLEGSSKKIPAKIKNIKSASVVSANQSKQHPQSKTLHVKSMQITYKSSQIPTRQSSYLTPSGVKMKASMSQSDNSTAHWFVAVGAGAQFPVSSASLRVNNGSDFSVPYNQDIYATKRDNGAVISLSAGRRWEHDSVWMSAYSLALSWQHYFDTNAGNTIMQNSDPTFLNYTYHWNFNSNLLLATAKLNLARYGKISPYINGGIGAAFNGASGYSETAFPGVTPRISPAFTNNNSTQFAYQAGTGFDVQATPQVIFSLGYNYQNVGNFSSGPGVGTWSGQTLNVGSFGSNEVLASLNYLFN